jgi:hypothetical protein
VVRENQDAAGLHVVDSYEVDCERAAIHWNFKRHQISKQFIFNCDLRWHYIALTKESSSHSNNDCIAF